MLIYREGPKPMDHPLCNYFLAIEEQEHEEEKTLKMLKFSSTSLIDHCLFRSSSINVHYYCSRCLHLLLPQSFKSANKIIHNSASTLQLQSKREESEPSRKAKKSSSKTSSAVPLGAALSAVSTGTTSSTLPMIYEPSLFTRIKQKFGFQGDLRYSQRVLDRSASLTYYMLQKTVDFDGLQRLLNMPDVYSTFGRLVFLHVWMVLLRYFQL
ncbi:unnamed protein product, partial [Didymodactylos carnosus]